MRLLNRSPRFAFWLACVVMAIPTALTLAGMVQPAAIAVVNPVDIMLRDPGRISLVLLLIALAIAPLRQLSVELATSFDCRYGKRMSDWNWLLRLRRPVGVASFIHAVAHLAIYIVFDLDLRMQEFTLDLRDKPFVAVGTASFLMLLPLALTSTDGWMRRMGPYWKRLHWLIYPAAVLAALHFILLAKPGVQQPLVFAVLLALLLGHRMAGRRRQTRGVQEQDDGTFPERTIVTPRPRGLQAKASHMIHTPTTKS
ncbi:MAG: ferric reductase-like transmembrane domain-containing protein [Herminiimonas sp.]|nr:ferric reductase-like transmembrane domain-containing protein [Herminiimonas sp.]